MKLSGEIDFDFPFVIFKKPDSSQVEIIIQKDVQLYKDFAIKTEGFYFYPYKVHQEIPIVFPKNKYQSNKFLLRNFELDANVLSYKIKDEQKLKDAHIHKVQRAIKLLSAKSGLEKLVISSKIDIQMDRFNWENTLLNLMHQYDHSMVWMWHHPKVGTWMGATPELLGSYKNGVFRTMALAGTLPIETNKPLVWSSKEIEEQDLVTRYIEKIIGKITKEYKVLPPATIFQGNIAHIQSLIQAQIDDDNFEKLILKLHPTPAVCGLPVDLASKRILEIENYNRKYYTGFLGLKQYREADFFVNLRVFEIVAKNQISIYVGGGILKNSVPEDEWHEIRYKSDVLSKYFSS